jgi:hypothetical protein
MDSNDAFRHKPKPIEVMLLPLICGAMRRYIAADKYEDLHFSVSFVFDNDFGC